VSAGTPLTMSGHAVVRVHRGAGRPRHRARSGPRPRPTGDVDRDARCRRGAERLGASRLRLRAGSTRQSSGSASPSSSAKRAMARWRDGAMARIMPVLLPAIADIRRVTAALNLAYSRPAASTRACCSTCARPWAPRREGTARFPLRRAGGRSGRTAPAAPW